MMTKSLGFFLAVSLAINAFLVVTMELTPRKSAGVPSSVQPVACPSSESDRHLYEALGLSRDQLEKVQPLARKFHERLDALQKEMESEKSLLFQLLASENIDRGQVEKLRKTMASIQDQIQQEIISHIVELKEILTPPQREHFLALVRQSVVENP